MRHLGAQQRQIYLRQALKKDSKRKGKATSIDKKKRLSIEPTFSIDVSLDDIAHRAKDSNCQSSTLASVNGDNKDIYKVSQSAIVEGGAARCQTRGDPPTQGRFDSQISSSKGAKYGKSLNATHHFFNVRHSGPAAAAQVGVGSRKQ